jgi:hypothetical protein
MGRLEDYRESRKKSVELKDVASVPIEHFPPSVRSLFAKFDKDGDGTVDAAELQEAAKMFEAAQSAEDGSIPIEQLPKELRPALKTFDMDGDGTIDPMELARGAELYAKSKSTVKKLTRVAVGLLLLLAVTIAAITGLTFVVVELSKETKASTDGTMLVNSNERQLMSTAAQSVNATLDSRMSDETLNSLSHFAVISPNGAHVRLNVLGTMRLPRECQGEIGSLVIIVTAVGQVTLDGTQMTFENDVGNYFAKAGFSVESSGRRLAGLAEIIAVFASLKEVDYLGFDGCTAGALPSVPENANYDYKILFQCVDPLDEFVDRCKHFDESHTTVVEGERYAHVHASAVAVKGEDGVQMVRRDMRMEAVAPDQIKTYIQITSADGLAQTSKSFQTFDSGINAGNVTWCSDNTVFIDEGDLHEGPKGPVVAFYDGVVDDTPMIGGSSRKFTLHFEDSSDTVWEYYDDPDTMKVQVIMQQSRLLGRTYYSFSEVTPLPAEGVDNAIFEVPEGSCAAEDATTPWIIPGTYHITSSWPFMHNQTLTASITYIDDGSMVNGEALLHEVLIASGATLHDYNEMVDHLPEGASLEEIGAALEAAPNPAKRHTARSLLAAEGGSSIAERIQQARDSYHERWVSTDDVESDTDLPLELDAHDGEAVAKTSALQEARKLQGHMPLDLWEAQYANLGSACKGKVSTAKTAEYFGIKFTLAKYWKNNVPCYLSGSSSKVIAHAPKVTISADVDVDFDAESFGSLTASGSISIRVEGDIKAATLYGTITLKVSGSITKKGGKKWTYGGYKSSNKPSKSYGTNAPVCYPPVLTISISGKIGVEVCGYEAASISVSGTMPIKFNTPNCKDYLLHYWKTYFCSSDFYPMTHTQISIDGSYSVGPFSDSFNIYESDRIVLQKGSEKWYTANSDCSMCIYPKYGHGYRYLCADENIKWKDGHPGR